MHAKLNIYLKTSNMSSSFQHTMSCSSCILNEAGWVNSIRRSLDEDEDDYVDEFSVCVFNVPKILMSFCPDCYVPQQLSLGPYHYRRPELHDMERYKLFAAKRYQKQLQSQNFEYLVEQLMKLEWKIRACYHKYLNYDGKTLAWMMALDASFLLDLLQVYAPQEAKNILNRVSPKMSHLLDYLYRKSAHHNVILRDIVMLENQIPLFILRKLLELQSLSIESADDVLLSMLTGLCKELSPFKRMKDLPKNKVSESAHLLDFLYRGMVPKVEEAIEMLEEAAEDGGVTQIKQNNKRSSSPYWKYAKQLLNQVWDLARSLNLGKLSFLKKLLQYVTITIKLPWTILSNFPGFEATNPSTASRESQNENSSIHDSQLIEEITIPSVTQLHRSGVRFVPTNGSISTIGFDMKTLAFYLPTICLDVNTEVILRNLAAYEASNESGAMVFTRYAELMNGIIDTEEDVKLLRERGIILNCLKSDNEAADMWNGMSRSTRLTKVPFLDKVIEDVNNHYGCQWKVKCGNFINQHVFDSWKLLTFLAAIVLLILMALQSFCSVYDCIGLLHLN